MLFTFFSSLVTLSNATEYTTSSIDYLFEATRVDDFTAVIMYIDVATGYGVSCQLISVSSQYTLPPEALAYYNYFEADDGDNPYVPYIVQYGDKIDITTVCSELYIHIYV